MKFYIASRLKDKKLVETIHKELTSRGHVFTSEWVKEGNLTPYEDYPEEAERLAIQCSNAINDCDVFILISDENGSGMYIELGMALERAKSSKTPKIFVIGKYNNSCVFFYHPLIKRMATFEDVFKEIGI